MPGTNGEFIPKPPLAQSNFHHRALGSSQRFQPDTPENLHRPNHEFMTDDQLREYVEKEIAMVREEHAKLGDPSAEKGGMRHVAMFEMIRDKFIIPNLRYLESIGRLPEGTDISTLQNEMTTPDGIK